MKTEKQLEILKKTITESNGFNGVLVESSDKTMSRQIRRFDPGMHVRARFSQTESGYIAVFDLDEECFECSLDNRTLQSAPITGVEVRDFGLSLILKTEEHFYLFNLENPLSVQG